MKGYIADEFGPEITQTQKEESKDGDGEDGPRPKQPRSSADRIGTSEVGILGGIIIIIKNKANLPVIYYTSSPLEVHVSETYWLA